MILVITPLYAAVLALMFLVLRTMVTVERARSGISILTGNNTNLAVKSRRFGNFIETVPFALILMGFAEMEGTAPALVHGAGILLLVSRLLHPLGLHPEKGNHPLRILSGVLTMATFALGAAAILWQLLAA
ncbi:MAG TPA: hypothetical protein ENJ68_03925 [Devosia sp.]|nr:hypothetical protein [Devosia sp.]